MKTLLIVRHAKSSWKNPDLDDFERPLNNRGRRAALVMGAVLERMGVSPDRILSSPACRAAMTARTIAAAIGYPLTAVDYREALYRFEREALVPVVAELDDACRRVMIVGHNPAVEGLAGYIAGCSSPAFATGAACRLDLDIPSWGRITEGSGTVVFFEIPKKHISPAKTGPSEGG